MKKILFTLFAGLFISLAAIAQTYTVTVNGHVMEIIQNNMIPVPDQEVIITIDSSGSGFNYQSTVYTDESGYYEDVIEIPGYNGYEFVQAMTFDSCQGQYLYDGQFIVPGIELMPMDFYLCNYAPPDCQALFYYYQVDPVDPYTFIFMNESIGNYTEVTWDFGDSTYSNEINPTHTFPGPGTYYVCLTISNGSDCNSTFCEIVDTEGGWNGCENYFLYYNSNNDQYTITFEGFLTNGQYADYYSWDFGDGTYGEGQTISHTFTPGGAGMYMVSLSTMVSDSMGGDSCFYTSYQEVWIENQPGCNSYFTYYPDSSNMLIINFMDLSGGPNGNNPDSWFWEFGDSTTSTLQNPVHTYADTGYYMVCLTIADSSGMCTSTYCEEIYTGYPPPPSDCESFILPINMYGLTVDFEGYTISPYETEYTWEFGDSVTGTGQYVSHTYASSGMYNVTLETVDATGCEFQTFMQVWVDTLYQGCSNFFSYDQTDSLTYTFSGMVYLNNGGTYTDSLSTYLWDFGDGTTGTGQTITHTFQENGSGEYTVCLTTNTILPDGSECSAVSCQPVFLGTFSFTIYGSVYLSQNMAADQAVVRLMSMDTLWQGVVEIASTTIDSGGFYSFVDLPMYNDCLYFVQAELTEGSSYFGEYVPTYHIDALSWEEAMPILPLENWPADIFMIAGSPVNGGNGIITGVVSELGSRGFLSDVEVVLMDEDSSPLMYLRSDDQGLFTFENLPLGTYIIHAEIMGIHTNQAEVTLSDDSPEAGVEVQVSNGEATIVFGISEPIVLEQVSDIYPNPINELSQLDISVNKAVKIELSLFGQSGQLLRSSALSLDNGTHSIMLDMGDLPAGLYLLRISTDHGESISRKLMKVQ